MARVPADATAFAHRASRIMVNVAAFFDGPEDRIVQEAWVSEVAAELEQDDHSAYVNFIGDEGADRIRAAYPGPTLARLAAIKARYDPTNLLHLNPERGAGTGWPGRGLRRRLLTSGRRPISMSASRSAVCRSGTGSPTSASSGAVGRSRQAAEASSMVASRVVIQ